LPERLSEFPVARRFAFARYANQHQIEATQLLIPPHIAQPLTGERSSGKRAARDQRYWLLPDARYSLMAAPITKQQRVYWIKLFLGAGLAKRLGIRPMQVLGVVDDLACTRSAISVVGICKPPVARSEARPTITSLKLVPGTGGFANRTRLRSRRRRRE